MPTVLDEFVVEIGLDKTKFEAGEREAIASFEKTKIEALKFGTQLEDQGKRLSEIFGILKGGLVGVLGAFIGGEAAGFIANVQQMAASSGRLADSIGANIRNLSLWQGMLRQFGGTAQGTNAAITGVVNQITAAALPGGQLPWQLNAIFNQTGIANWRRLIGNPRMFDIMAEHIAQWAQEERARGVPESQIRQYIQSFSSYEPLVQALQKGPRGLDELRRAARPYEETEKEKKAAESLQQAIGRVDSALDKLGRMTLPTLTTAANVLADVFEKIVGSENKKSPYTAAAGGAGAAIGTVIGGMLGSLIPIPLVGTLGGAALGGIIGGTLGAYGGAQIPFSSAHAEPAVPYLFGPNAAGDKTSRGIRNNNPGNIKYGRFAVAHGAIGADSGGFAVFPNLDSGMSAADALLGSSAYGGLTLQQIVQKWTAGYNPSYLAAVENATNMGAEDRPNLSQSGIRAELLRGIMRGEGTSAVAGIPIGSGAAAKASAMTSTTTNSRTTHNSFNVGAVNLTSNKADPREVAAQIPDAVRRRMMTMPINGGLQ